jgi:hypothetical protein
MHWMDRTVAQGGRVWGQATTRSINAIFSLRSYLPFDTLPAWQAIRALSLAEQKHRLADPEVRRRLVAEEAQMKPKGAELQGGGAATTDPRKPDYENLFPMFDVDWDDPSVADLARRQNKHPVEVIIDLALENDNRVFVQPLVNESPADVLGLLKHPRSLATFSDSGAHVCQEMGSSLQTHLLSYWVRKREEFTLEEAVRMLTFDNASAWELPDRGLVRTGYAADIVVFDEAHKLSAHFFGREMKRTKRFNFAEKIGQHTRHLLLLTATPHNGKEEDFQLFLALLDADRFEGKPRDASHMIDPSDLMRRLVKEKLLDFDGRPLFPERHAYTAVYPLSDDETLLYKRVTDYVVEEMNRADRLKAEGEGSRGAIVGFALTTLQRRLASSPEAIYQSLLASGARVPEQKPELGMRDRDLDVFYAHPANAFRSRRSHWTTRVPTRWSCGSRRAASAIRICTSSAAAAGACRSPSCSGTRARGTWRRSDRTSVTWHRAIRW